MKDEKSLPSIYEQYSSVLALHVLNCLPSIWNSIRVNFINMHSLGLGRFDSDPNLDSTVYIDRDPGSGVKIFLRFGYGTKNDFLLNNCINKTL